MLEFHSLLKHPDDLLMSCQQFLHTCLSQELGCSPPLLGNLTDGDQRHLFGIPMFVWIGPVLRILPASAATKYGLKTFLDLKKKQKTPKKSQTGEFPAVQWVKDWIRRSQMCYSSPLSSLHDRALSRSDWLWGERPKLLCVINQESVFSPGQQVLWIYCNQSRSRRTLIFSSIQRRPDVGTFSTLNTQILSRMHFTFSYWCFL